MRLFIIILLFFGFNSEMLSQNKCLDLIVGNWEIYKKRDIQGIESEFKKGTALQQFTQKHLMADKDSISFEMNENCTKIIFQLN